MVFHIERHTDIRSQYKATTTQTTHQETEEPEAHSHEDREARHRSLRTRTRTGGFWLRDQGSLRGEAVAAVRVQCDAREQAERRRTEDEQGFEADVRLMVESVLRGLR